MPWLGNSPAGAVQKRHMEHGSVGGLPFGEPAVTTSGGTLMSDKRQDMGETRTKLPCVVARCGETLWIMLALLYSLWISFYHGTALS